MIELPLALSFVGTIGRQPPEIFFGGWHWLALGLAVWEQLTGLGLSLGLLALLLTVTGLLATYMLAYLARRVRGLRAIL